MSQFVIVCKQNNKMVKDAITGKPMLFPDADHAAHFARSVEANKRVDAIRNGKQMRTYRVEELRPTATDALHPARVTDGSKTVYVKESCPADVMSSDNSHSTGMRRLSVGTELTAFQQSDKGVFFKDSSGTIYHIRLDECSRYLSKTKAKDRAALHRALDAALDGAKR